MTTRAQAPGDQTETATQPGTWYQCTFHGRAGYIWVECEDLGGPWRSKPPDDRPHGLNIVEALAGPHNWGTETTSDGDRIVWARLNLPRKQPSHDSRPGPAHAAGHDASPAQGPPT
jgi:hypothetical protein